MSGPKREPTAKDPSDFRLPIDQLVADDLAQLSHLIFTRENCLLKKWFKDGAKDFAVELAVAVVFAAGYLFLRGIDWGLQALVGPRLAPVAWVVLLFAALTRYCGAPIKRARQ